MTGKELLSTRILDAAFEQLKTTEFWKQQIADYISHLFNSLLITKRLKAAKDPARLYVEKLERDYRKLKRIETHRQDVDRLRYLIRIKKDVGREYIALFRKLPKKNSYADLFILTVFNFLSFLRYEERLEIISALRRLSTSHGRYLGTKTTPEDPTAAVRKRLQRIRKTTSRSFGCKNFLLKNIPYIKVQDIRVMNIKKISKRIPPILSENDIIMSRVINKGNVAINKSPDIRLKNSEKNRESHLKNRIDKIEKALAQLQQNKLKHVIRKLKISCPQEALNAVIHDSEFTNAFKLPSN